MPPRVGALLALACACAVLLQCTEAIPASRGTPPVGSVGSVIGDAYLDDAKAIMDELVKGAPQPQPPCACTGARAPPARTRDSLWGLGRSESQKAALPKKMGLSTWQWRACGTELCCAGAGAAMPCAGWVQVASSGGAEWSF